MCTDVFWISLRVKSEKNREDHEGHTLSMSEGNPTGQQCLGENPTNVKVKTKVSGQFRNKEGKDNFYE
jgi:hypothetical protein